MPDAVPMKINGQTKEIPSGMTLSMLIEQMTQDMKTVIAEVNGEIVARESWAGTSLREGDTVELVSIVGGG